MKAHPSPCVYKYLELADRFVRVRVVDARDAGLEAAPGLNRSGYRRAVISACIEELRDDLPAALFELCPGEPGTAEDELYRLCIAVNPSLDIHAVSLADRGAERRRRSAADFRRRLARRARGLEDRLAERVVGQERAIDAVARAVRRAASGLANDGRPLGSLLFVGRTGTGKTELVRALADGLFGDADALVRVDCAELAQPHETSRLTGAPPGYVGHEGGGALTEALAERGERIVLFDEVEKAHPRLADLLLGVLDDGRLTDGKGRTVSFARSFVVLTSNAGAQELARADERLGFGGGAGTGSAARGEIALRALAERFRPEFLGRLDETVVFRELVPKDARAIARRALSELATRVRRAGHRVEFSAAVAPWVAREGFSRAAGAREIARVVRRALEAPLAERMLARGKSRGRFVVRIRRGRPELRDAA